MTYEEDGRGLQEGSLSNLLCLFSEEPRVAASEGPCHALASWVEGAETNVSAH